MRGREEPRVKTSHPEQLRFRGGSKRDQVEAGATQKKGKKSVTWTGAE